MNLVKILPLSFVMIAGPQILSAIFLATGESWRRNSLAFVSGAAVSMTTMVTLAYFLAGGKTHPGTSDDGLDVLGLVLLALAALYIYVKRETSKPPSWMGKLQTADAGFSFKLGFLLLGVVPGDLFAGITVGSYLSNHGDPYWHLLPFIGLTLLLLALPSLIVVALGARGEAFLPKARDWMHDNSWVVSEIVIAFFALIVLNSLLG